MQKAQASLLVANVAVLTFFLTGVAVIVHTEAPADTFDVAPAPQPCTNSVVRQEDAAVPEAPEAPVARSHPVCEARATSYIAPLLFAFLAGGIMNVPEVTNLPCM